MTKLFLRGRSGGLYGIDRYSADSIVKLMGREVECEVRQPRNLKHHRKYWALCSLCADNSSYTAEQVNDIFKLRCGITTQSQLADGTIVQHPGSISFAKMDQTGFAEFYDRVMSVVLMDILPGVKQPDLERELRELIG